MKRRSVPWALLWLIVAIIGVILALRTQAATTITVTTTDDVIADDGQCSLREAVVAANTNSAFHDCPAGSGSDTIAFDSGLPAPATFTLTLTGAGEDAAMTGDLDISGSLTISGAGAGQTIIDGNASDRVFEIPAGANATLSGLTIRNGDPGAGEGGGIRLRGSLRLTNSVVDGNQSGGVVSDGGSMILTDADVTNNVGHGIHSRNGAYTIVTRGSIQGNQGGGLYTTLSTAELSQVTIALNTGGGGVHNTGATMSHLKLSQCTVISNTTTGAGGGVASTLNGAVAQIYGTRISGNTAAGAGGGVYNGATMTIVGSTIDGNQGRSGGGIDHAGATLTMSNDTVTGNTVTDNGGGIYVRADANLTNVTIANNSPAGAVTGGSIYADSGQISFHNSIILHSATGSCVTAAGVIHSLGYNLESGDSCGFHATGDIVNTDPLLGPLQDNGGSTFTHALLPDSPAIDAADAASHPLTDQRGVARPQGAGPDIGAYEVVPASEADLAIVKSASVDTVPAGTPLNYTLSVSNAGPDAAALVTVADTLPAGVTYVSASGTGWSCGYSAGTVTCTRPELVVGSAPAIQISVTAPGSEGTIVNTASVGAATTDPNGTNDTAGASTTVTPPPPPEADLSVAKLGPASVQTGAPLTYALHVSNVGPDSAATVTVTDTLPAGVVYVNASGSGWSCGQAGGVVTCSRPSLSLGNAPDVTVQATAPTSVGTIVNDAVIGSTTADPVGTNNADSASTTVVEPGAPQTDLWLAKACSQALVPVGGTTTYTLTVGNAGPMDAADIVVTDSLPGDVTYIAASGAGWTCHHTAGVVHCDAAALAVGASSQIVVTASVPWTAGPVTNTASVGSAMLDPQPANDSASVATMVSFVTYLPCVLR